jgi:hypothetical protein
MNDYDTLLYSLGKLYVMLVQAARQGKFQGEHTIHVSLDSVATTVHVYIDGTSLQIQDTPGSDHFPQESGAEVES